MRRAPWWRRAAAVLSAAVVLCLGSHAANAAPARADGPSVHVAPKEGGTGGRVSVTGRGWQPGTLLTVLICGQNAIGGTSSCANGAGRTATTDRKGRFAVKPAIAEPPKPCPCVVHVASVTGAGPVVVDAPFTVAGHPVAELPEATGSSGRLVVLAARLEGSNGLLNWFGAPPHRELVITVGNTGSTPARDPSFRLGSAHSVFAPEWQDVRWNGSVPPGGKKRISFPVELAMGAHGDYKVSLRYRGRLLTDQPWDVPRPWGVTLFWVLLCVVVPSAVFRAGLAAVNHFAPPRGRRRRQPASPAGSPAPALPWFAPGTVPGPGPHAPGHQRHQEGGGTTS